MCKHQGQRVGGRPHVPARTAAESKAARPACQIGECLAALAVCVIEFPQQHHPAHLGPSAHDLLSVFTSSIPP